MKNVFAQAQAAMKHLIKHSTHKHRSGMGVVTEATRQLLNFSLLRTPFRLAAVLCFLLTIGVGEAWGTSYISYEDNTQDASTTISTSNVSSGSAGKISWTGTSCTYSSNRVNIAANGSITFTATTGYNITKIVIISGSTSAYYGTWTSSPSVTPSSSSGTTTFDGLSANSVTVTTSTAFRCTSASSIKIYYTEAVSSCSDPATALSITSASEATVGTPLTLTTSGGNGGSVTWSVVNGTGAATVDGSTLNPTSAGTVTVKATQGENTVSGTTYCGKEVTKTVTISKAAATITLSEAGNTTAIPGVHYGGDSYSLPALASVTCSGKEFVGWSTVEVAETDTKPSSNFYAKGADATLAAGSNTFYAVFAKATISGVASWSATAIGDLTESDIVVIATSAGYAMTNNNGTDNPPSAVSITISEGKITSTVANSMKWNIGGNSTDGYIFYPDGSTTTWLYCSTTASSGTNNNIRVGTGDRKYWIADSDGDYVTNDNYTDRWLCNYSNSDFRGYVASAVTNDIIHNFYKYDPGKTYSKYSTTCCTPLGSINGSFTLSRKQYLPFSAEAALSD